MVSDVVSGEVSDVVSGDVPSDTVGECNVLSD